MELDIERVEQLGPLASVIFGRICGIGGDVKGVFSAEAIEAYAQQLGRAVDLGEVQPTVNALMEANLLMRLKHGHYGVTDAFIEKAWVEREKVTKALQ